MSLRSILSQKFCNAYSENIKDENGNIIYGHMQSDDKKINSKLQEVTVQLFTPKHEEKSPPNESAHSHLVPCSPASSESSLSARAASSVKRKLSDAMPPLAEHNFSYQSNQEISRSNFRSNSVPSMVKLPKFSYESIPSMVKTDISEDEQKYDPNQKVVYGLECAICTQTFRNKTHLCYHLKICHNFEITYLCCVCSASFPCSASCNKHIQEECIKQCISMASSPAPVMMCKLCYKCFHTQFLMDSHILNHYYRLYPAKRPYLCLQCDTTMYGEESYLLHKSIHDTERKKYLKEQLKLNGETAKFKILLQNQSLFCYLCETLVLGTEAFYNHMTTVHKMPLSCHSCSLVISDVDELNMHVIIHAHGNSFPDSDVKEEIRPFLCTVCDRQIDGKKAFQEHFVYEHMMMQSTVG